MDDFSTDSVVDDDDNITNNEKLVTVEMVTLKFLGRCTFITHRGSAELGFPVSCARVILK